MPLAHANTELMILFAEAPHSGFAVQSPEESLEDVQNDSPAALLRGVSIISGENAVTIFLSKTNQIKGDRLAMRLAKEFGISAKAVRDIWNLRTWAHATKQHWSPADTEKFLNKRLCHTCRNRGFTSMQQACSTCQTIAVRRPTVTQHREVPSSSTTPRVPTNSQPAHAKKGTSETNVCAVETCSIQTIGEPFTWKQVPHAQEYPCKQGADCVPNAGQQYHHQSQHMRCLPQQQNVYPPTWEMEPHQLGVAQSYHHIKYDTHRDLLSPDDARGTEMAGVAAGPLPRDNQLEWMFDVALVARDFAQVLDEWETIAAQLRAERII
eukprot:CAMPEP_0179421312 /NCGR_PEP_ID=MMETSP0799-20121207/9693_1 /TAXON_ID=46947 /ORGANISM="Geminigera cryophila, Strain CCMP2564" /LENGTH=322 /DNA_ID=CAMNT_0021195099 /DNA_START=33 /DNA_END=1001 /DNA_ORIENTATION=-